MVCRICEIDKVEEDFHYHKKGENKRKTCCKECAKDYRKKYYEANREKSIEYSKNTNKSFKIKLQQYICDYLSENPCIVCGEGDPIVLEFDHRDVNEKYMNVCNMVNTRHSLKKIINEIDKCDILCSNCHKRKTSIQFDWYSKIKK